MLRPLLGALLYAIELRVLLLLPLKTNLECEMFQEMCGAIGSVCFGSATSIYPDTDGGGLSPGRVFCRDLDML